MNYSSPSLLEETGVSPRESLPPHIWITERFFSPCPCTRIISINLQCNICESLFISPYFFSLSPLWFGVCSLGLHQAAKSLQVPDVLLLCGGRAGGCRTAGRPQLLEEEQSGKMLYYFKAIKDLYKYQMPHSQKWKLIPRNAFLWTLFCSKQWIFPS